MKIAYVGNRKNKASDGKSFNTENHIALTLEKLGHEVAFIQEDELIPPDLARQVVAYHAADLFLWTRSWPDKVTVEELRKIESAGVPTVSFHLDKYTGIARDGGMGVNSAFWQTQYVFSPEGSIEAQRTFKNHKINQFYLPAGVYEDECFKGDWKQKFAHDVVFVGGGVEYMHPEWSYRGKLVKWLMDTYGDRFGKYGNPQETIRGTELNDLYASSKIIVGDSLCKDFTDSFYYSDRVFETTGRGGFMIHPYIPGITQHFQDRKEIVLYSLGNFEQLKNLIDYYLIHDFEREDIRDAGHIRTKKTNTYTNRMKHMLAVLKREGAINEIGGIQS